MDKIDPPSLPVLSGDRESPKLSKPHFSINVARPSEQRKGGKKRVFLSWTESGFVSMDEEHLTSVHFRVAVWSII